MLTPLTGRGFHRVRSHMWCFSVNAQFYDLKACMFAALDLCSWHPIPGFGSRGVPIERTNALNRKSHSRTVHMYRFTWNAGGHLSCCRLRPSALCSSPIAMPSGRDEYGIAPVHLASGARCQLAALIGRVARYRSRSSALYTSRRAFTASPAPWYK